MKTPTQKQRAVLDRMRAGASFRDAYNQEGLSDYGRNMEAFLFRMVEAGFITLTVVP